MAHVTRNYPVPAEYLLPGPPPCLWLAASGWCPVPAISHGHDHCQRHHDLTMASRIYYGAEVFRTFESFDIEWSDGASWSGFDTREEAERLTDPTRHHIPRSGVVVRKTFEVKLDRELLQSGAYQPGVGDRIV